MLFQIRRFTKTIVSHIAQVLKRTIMRRKTKQVWCSNGGLLRGREMHTLPEKSREINGSHECVDVKKAGKYINERDRKWRCN
jgi:hypothetical protein